MSDKQSGGFKLGVSAGHAVQVMKGQKLDVAEDPWGLGNGAIVKCKSPVSPI